MSSFLTNVMIGQYVPVRSFVHRLDPRMKVICLFLWIVFIFVAQSFLSYLPLFLFLISVILVARIPVSLFWRGFKPIWLILVITFVFHIWFHREGQVLWQWGMLVVYDEGLVQAIRITGRIALLIIGASMLTFTTKPLDLTDGLEKLFGPLKKIRVPVHELALMTAIALRFIPTLLGELEKIMKAQIARGASYTTGSFVQRFKHLFTLFIPLFISAFQRADDLALAMEARAYRGGEGRTKLRQLTFLVADYVAFLVTVIVCGSVLLL